MKQEVDIADLIAGELQVSRGTAYELMHKALAAQQAAEPTDEQIAATAGRMGLFSQSRPLGQQWENIYSLVRRVIAERVTAPTQQPLTEAAIDSLYQHTVADERTKTFTAQNWFQAGVAMAEAAHHIASTNQGD